MTTRKAEGIGGWMVVGTGVAAFAGTMLGELLSARPPEGAPESAKLDYAISLVQQFVASQLELISLNKQVLSALKEIRDKPAAELAPVIPETQIQVVPVTSVRTPWIAREPEKIFDQTIRNAGVFLSDFVDFRVGKRLLLKIESSLDQAVQVQVIGDITKSDALSVNIGLAVACPGPGQTSIGLAWDDWHPWVAVRITVLLAPTTGYVRIWQVIQD
jgi:hypothetical protein